MSIFLDVDVNGNFQYIMPNNTDIGENNESQNQGEPHTLILFDQNCQYIMPNNTDIGENNESQNQGEPHTFILFDENDEYIMPNSTEPESLNQAEPDLMTIDSIEKQIKETSQTDEAQLLHEQRQYEVFLQDQDEADVIEANNILYYICDELAVNTVSPETPAEVRDYNNLIQEESEVELENHEHFIFGTASQDDPNNSNSSKQEDDTNFETMNSQSNDHSISPEQTDFNENPAPFNVSIKPQNGCDNALMIVPTSNCGSNKKLCCMYCHKRYSKLARHLQTVHKDKDDVKKFRDLPTRSKERRDIIDIIRKRGMFEWNINSDINNGELSMSRRPSQKLGKKARDYATCVKCFGTFTTTNLRHHVNKCTNNAFKRERIVTVLGRAVEGRLHEKACDLLRLVIFPVLREDDVVRLIRYDWLVILFGNQLCLKYSPHYQHNMIRSKLRYAGRLLQAVKSTCPEITDFACMYQPQFYNAVIEAIRKVASFDPILSEYETPATASCMVTQVKQMGLLLRSEYIRQRDKEKKTDTDDFLTLMEATVGLLINKTVSDNQAKMKRHKKEVIPTTNDVNRLQTYLDQEREKALTQLTMKYSDANWLNLLELTMALIMVYNRKRTGETQNILISDFRLRESINEASELYDTLSDEDQRMVKDFCQVKIRGKKGRPIYVLLKAGWENCIELLLRHRKNANIADSNDFLFALPSCTGRIKVVDACSKISKYADLCGADNPKSLRGTTLRKHMASMCIKMGLTDNVVSEVASFMGHNEKVHRDYYRHNTLEREVVQMSKILDATLGNRKDGTENDVGHYNNPTSDNTITDVTNANFPQDKTEFEDEFICRSITDVTNANFSQGKTELEDGLSADVCLPMETEFVASKITRKRSISQEHLTEESAEENRYEDNAGKKKFKKKRWGEDELKAVYEAFPTHFSSKKLPSFKEISKQQEIHSSLKNRSCQQIKTWISNQFKKPS